MSAARRVRDRSAAVPRLRRDRVRSSRVDAGDSARGGAVDRGAARRRRLRGAGDARGCRAMEEATSRGFRAWRLVRARPPGRSGSAPSTRRAAPARSSRGRRRATCWASAGGASRTGAARREARGGGEIAGAAAGHDVRCAGLVFVPIASATTPSGGLLVGGRCDDDWPANLKRPALLVAHGLPGVSSWIVKPVPGTELLDGIVNVALFARSDTDAALVAYEPFKPPAERRAFVAHHDGKGWRESSSRFHDRPDERGRDAGRRAVVRCRARRVPRGCGRRRGEGGAAEAPVRVGKDRCIFTYTRSAPSAARCGSRPATALTSTGPMGRGASPCGGALFANVPGPRPVDRDAREPAAGAVYEVE